MIMKRREKKRKKKTQISHTKNRVITICRAVQIYLRGKNLDDRRQNKIE